MIIKILKQRIIQYGDIAEQITFTKPVYVHSQENRTYSRSKVEERRNDSLTRTRNILYQRIYGNIKKHGSFPPIFLTLTIAENICSLKQSNPLFSDFIRRLNYRCYTNLKYICIPEFQERGAVHYHVIFFNLPFIHYSVMEEIWGHGSIRIELSKNIKNLAAYMAKYLTKDIIDKRLAGHRIIITSKGLLKSTIFDNDDIALFRDRFILSKELSFKITPEKKQIKYQIKKYKNKHI